jgi:hypothetical protein
MALDKNVVQVLTIFLVGSALILTAVGGFIDMTGRPLYISKEHAWSDGIFLLGLAILLNVLS